MLRARWRASIARRSSSSAASRARRRPSRSGAAPDGDETRIVLVGRLPWWARGRLRRRISALVMCPGAAGAPADRGVTLRDGAGTLA
jgi:hypothetical protein